MNWEKALSWLPAMIVLATISGAAFVGQHQLGALAGELLEAEEDIEENAEDIESIQRRLIERQGEIGLDLQSLKIKQEQQNEKLDEVLNLLREQG